MPDNMKIIALAIAIIAFGVTLLLLIAKVRKTAHKQQYGVPNKFKKISFLFTPAEKHFYRALTDALVNDDIIVLGKVRVADILTPHGHLPQKAWWAMFNKISRKHFDFVLINSTDLTPICAIELNDRSHDTEHRKTRDRFLRSACNDANFKLVMVSAKKDYNLKNIRNQVL